MNKKKTEIKKPNKTPKFIKEIIRQGKKLDNIYKQTMRF
jgi:hypothetical protein